MDHGVRAGGRAVAPGVPAFLLTRPALVVRSIERPRVWALLDRAVSTHRICLVVAPAGYGKTQALAGWAARSVRQVAWLSLTDADRHPEHLARGLALALARLPAESDSLTPAVLVIDDVHLVDGVAARRVLSPFLEHLPSGLTVVLSTRSEPGGLGLSRFEVRGELTVLLAGDLSFTTDELHQAVHASERDPSAEQERQLHEATRGWPVAVRLALMTRRSRTEAPAGASIPEIGRLPEYLVENVLTGLPAGLPAFVLMACTCDWLTGSIADDLTGGSRGAELLDAALAAGLPLERREAPGGEPVYRWHPLMAQAGRQILLRQDPAFSRELDRRAARALAVLDPFEAASHALRGKDPELGASLIPRPLAGCGAARGRRGHRRVGGRAARPVVG